MGSQRIKKNDNYFYVKHLPNWIKVLNLHSHYQQSIAVLYKIMKCENSSVGRARPCQGRGRGFEPRFSLKPKLDLSLLKFYKRLACVV